MTRPALDRSNTGGITIYVPEDVRRSMLVDIAIKLTNSDKAIQDAVTIAKQHDQGAITDKAIRNFERSSGAQFGPWIFMSEKEAIAFADELCELLHGDRTIEIMEQAAAIETTTKSVTP